MELDAFHGIRYAPEVVGDLADVTAPPYDAIDEEQQRTLHAASPLNVVRLELGLDLSGDDDTTNRYQRAAAQYAAWRREGVLVPDGPGPRMHVYEQSFTDDAGRERRQVGLLAALRLAPWDEGVVLPHERVFRTPVEDRKRLLRALPVNVSPVFVLYEGRAEHVEAAIDAAGRTAPTDEFACEDGVVHRHWPLDDGAAVAAIRAELDDRVALMADGHHRYTTALEYRDEGRAPAGARDVLAYVVCEDDGPEVRASHRLVRRLPAGWRASLRELGLDVGRSWPGTHPDRVLRELERDDVAFGLITRDRTEALVGPRPEAIVPDGTHPVLAGLDVTAVQHLLVDRLQVPDRIEELRYTADLDGAVDALARDEAEALFVVRPVTLAQVRAAATAGVRLPPKSTSFQPKPRTGLVLRPLVAPGGRRGTADAPGRP